MPSAWVITHEGTRHRTEVIGILSARKSDKRVKEQIEWLYALLYSHPDQHLAYARYVDPVIPYEAEYDKTNTGVPVNSVMRCGDNPYLVARLAKNVAMVDEDQIGPILKWTNPERLVCDIKRPYHIVEKIPGAKCQAPIRLPLLTRRGLDPHDRVTITSEPDKFVPGRREARARVIAAGLTDDDIDRLIKRAQQEVEPAPR